MAKVKVIVPQQILSIPVDRALKKVLVGDTAMKRDVGRTSVERIKGAARSGKPMNNTGKFPKLKPSTVKNRRYLQKYNPVHPVFNPNRSNLTITGQLIDGLTFDIDAVGEIDIFTEGARKPYRKQDGSPIPLNEVSKTNETLVEALAEKGFFLFQSKGFERRMSKQIRNIALKYIRRALAIANRL